MGSSSLMLPSWAPNTGLDGTGSWTKMGSAWAAVPSSPVMWDCPGYIPHLPLHSTTPHLLPPSAKKSFAPNGTPVLPSLFDVTHLGCCSRWSCWPQVEVGVGRGTGQGPGLRSSP